MCEREGVMCLVHMHMYVQVHAPMCVHMCVQEEGIEYPLLSLSALKQGLSLNLSSFFF